MKNILRDICVFMSVVSGLSFFVFVFLISSEVLEAETWLRWALTLVPITFAFFLFSKKLDEDEKLEVVYCQKCGEGYEISPYALFKNCPLCEE